jgi:hypothetical protein
LQRRAAQKKFARIRESARFAGVSIPRRSH